MPAAVPATGTKLTRLARPANPNQEPRGLTESEAPIAPIIVDCRDVSNLCANKEPLAVPVSVYLASPLGFAASTRAFMIELAGRLREHVTVVNPWDDQRFAAEFAELDHVDSVRARLARLREINTELGRANTASIDGADAVFAVLDGVDVDSGTAAEIGYAFARGKYVAGLRTDFRLAGDNPGSIVNLQVQYFIEKSGGKVETELDAFVALARQFVVAEADRRAG